MFSGVPNLVSTFGYINASWTLKADLTAEYCCRLLNHLDANGYRECKPRLRREDQAMKSRPWITEFTPGYIQRAVHLMPMQGDHEPWINPQNYGTDRKMFLQGEIDDGALVFR
jgi:hypothetical protein